MRWGFLCIARLGVLKFGQVQPLDGVCASTVACNLQGTKSASFVEVSRRPDQVAAKLKVGR
jgi:hypothetical protein